jgi:nucleoside-diphosphate-sugar epimerase|tara:strand:+ start:102 stop:956 length:855 start_codon:yes stop_codon:yes gene_type:complete
MTILVTGTSGFIGSNLVKYLQKKNLKFYGVDKISNPYFKFKNFYKINLKDKNKISKLILKKKIKKVIHLAAMPGFVSCHNNPDKAFNDNILATFNLLVACKNNEVKNILIASSMGVKNFFKSPSIYGMSKFTCENFCKTFNVLYKMNIKICKISNVFGPYSSHKSSAIHAFAKKIIKGKKIQIHKNGMQERDFIFSEDVCKKMLNVMKKNNKTKDIGINNNKFLRVVDLINIFKKITKKKIAYEFIKTPEGYDDKVYKKKISIKNKDLIKKIALTFNWYMSNYK